MLSRAVRMAAVRAPVALQTRTFVAPNQALDKKGMANERDFINRAERELLSALLKKAEAADHAHEQSSGDALANILKKYNVKPSAELTAALKEWRATTY